ncbi:hypothetical protein [Winogradskyella helgolandensis]|uniref:hypothetical protein n=1 Tax=Winogradskyella helgolandensis TaxID=2697010 RepID=UPI0015C7385E|nr:hypothetical protein [Winogradskyella helgolandensis]
MNERVLIILRKLINVLRYIFTGFWGFLTIIVIIYLIHRYSNPGWKSISNRDLKDYGKISLIFFSIFGILTFLKYSITKKLNKNEEK